MSLCFPLQLWGLNGLAQGGIFPLLLKIVAPCVDQRNKGTVMGVWTTSQQFGGATANALIGAAVTSYSWRAAFLLPAIPVAVSAVGLGLVLPRIPSIKAVADAELMRPTSPKAAAGVFRSAVSVLPCRYRRGPPLMHCLVLIYVCCSTAMQSEAFHPPLHLEAACLSSRTS